MIRFLVLLLAGLLCFAPALAAQHGGGRAAPPVLTLPAQDNAALLQREVAVRKPGRPREFAVSLPVAVSPATDGKWSQLPDGRARWQLRVRSAGAKSLNLGFRQFHLPAGAELYLSTNIQRYGPFTAADNEDHDQFWSPVLPGDELMIELILPYADREGVDLQLTTVNHDFEGVVNALSGNCNVDVACGAADDFPMIDEFRDVIRSVAAYTLNGRSQCTGFLVNNTNQDGRPLFLTAAHCGVDLGNAPSLVAYWNFEHSRCRTPGSVESGGRGDGSLEVFNTGARLRASYAVTDFALLELDEPVNPLANAFFAGWSATGPPPAGGVLTVHHPNVQEKRISFSFQPTRLSTITGQAAGGDGNFLRVPAWDIGTTEGGSSGAPLFDFDGRARGQLFGGRASCGNAGDDVFGYLASSWTGGGSPDSRLRDWLDPCGSGARITDGLEQAELPYLLTAATACITRCVSDSATFEVRLGEGFPAGSTLRLSADPALSLDVPEVVDGGSSFTLTYRGSPTLPGGTYPITLTATGGDIAGVLELSLSLLDEVPGPVVLNLPATGAATVAPFATLAWQPLAGAVSYDLQLALSADFSSRAADLTGLGDTSFLLRYPLNGGATYYWRVRARNACGAGGWSQPRSFTTEETSCALKQSGVLPVAIPPEDSVRVVAELEVTDPVLLSSLEVVVGIEHSFIGDLYASLVGPDGTELPLFRPLENGLCPGRDLYAVFSDAGEITADSFQLRCDDGQAGDYRSVQPIAPFASLYGTSARGTWKLIVTDRVPKDGGQITDFRLRFCAAGTDPRDLAVGVLDSGIVACSNAGATTRLQLGSGFTQPGLAVEADGQPLDNFTYDLIPATNTLEVTFSAWTFIGAGTHDLSFLVTDADGSVRRAVTTLTVLPLPEAIVPLPAAVDSATVTFHWRRSDRASSYTVEVSPTVGFSSIAVAGTTAANQLSIPRDDLPAVFYWRVVARNGCGSFPGPPRAIALDTTTAVREFTDALFLDVYPNPSRGTLHLSLADTPAARQLSASLYSSSGQRVLEWLQLQGPRIDLQLGAAPPGVYFLRISGPAGGATRRILLLGQ